MWWSIQCAEWLQQNSWINLLLIILPTIKWKSQHGFVLKLVHISWYFVELFMQLHTSTEAHCLHQRKKIRHHLVIMRSFLIMTSLCILLLYLDHFSYFADSPNKFWCIIKEFCKLPSNKLKGAATLKWYLHIMHHHLQTVNIFYIYCPEMGHFT